MAHDLAETLAASLSFLLCCRDVRAGPKANPDHFTFVMFLCFLFLWDCYFRTDTHRKRSELCDRPLCFAVRSQSPT